MSKDRQQQFWIDGYNVIHRLFPGGDLARARQELIRRAQALGQPCCIFFDSREFMPWRREKSGRVTVEFSRQGSADDLIFERLSAAKDRRGIVIVTDDRELRRRCEFLGAGNLSVEKFGQSLLPAAPARTPEDDKSRDRKLSRSEVNEWLRYFGQDPTPDQNDES